MSIYTVIFKLQHEDYDEANAVLTGYEASWQAMPGAWVIETQDDVANIRDDLAKTIGHADRVLVVETGDSWAANNVKETEWLQQHT